VAVEPADRVGAGRVVVEIDVSDYRRPIPGAVASDRRRTGRTRAQCPKEPQGAERGCAYGKAQAHFGLLSHRGSDLHRSGDDLSTTSTVSLTSRTVTRVVASSLLGSHVTPPRSQRTEGTCPIVGRVKSPTRCPLGLGATSAEAGRRTLHDVETDDELLSGLLTGDEQAFVMLVGRYQQPMLRLASSMVSSQQVAEEAVQDTWLGVVRGIEQFKGNSSFKTWLFRILVNRVRSAGSREPADPSIEVIRAVDPAGFDSDGQWADPVEHWTEATENRLDAATWLPVLKSALVKLPARQRQVVLLRDAEGLSSEEACSVLGIGVGNQRILLHRGRTRLREILDAEIGKR
jgi:RNA polymerase sigma-70 factor, ECF subfamily